MIIDESELCITARPCISGYSIRMAYGFRNPDNLISLILLRCGDLPVKLPGRVA